MQQSFYTRQVLKSGRNFEFHVLHRGNIFLIFYMEWNLADGNEENIALNSRYEKSGKNLLWRFSEK